MFWDKFYSLCTKNGTSPNAVAKILGFSSGSVTSWKNGTNPRPAVIVRISEYFEVPVEYFLKDNSEEQIKKDPIPKTGNEVSDFDEFALNIIHKLKPEYREDAIAHLLELAAKSEGRK